MESKIRIEPFVCLHSIPQKVTIFFFQISGESWLKKKTAEKEHKKPEHKRPVGTESQV